MKTRTAPVWKTTAVTLTTTLLLTACADDGMPPIAVTPPVALQQTCAQIATMTVPASSIGLPTTGATVTSATTVAAANSGAAAIGEYCRVLVDIAPLDATAPRIRMQVSLPTVWNGKAMMFGGGGYDGSIPSGAGNVPAGPTDQLVPLGRGYATFSSDSGHQGGALGSQDGSFGVNDEAVANFSGDALKKTRDVALAVVKARYGVAGFRKAYFAGGSSGGREALEVVQKWPRDWDGAIVLYPAGAAASLDLQFGRVTRALAQPGAYPSQAKRKRLYDAALQACDGLDGVTDGLVSNVRACNALFDPSTATIGGVALRCAGGTEGGDSCLSDAQITALNVFNTPITFAYPLASGETQYPGFNTWGTDLGNPGSSAVQPTVTFLAFSTGQPANPMPTTAPYGSIFWDQWVRFFVTRDPNFNSLTLDPQNPGVYQARISALTGLQDVNQTDLPVPREGRPDPDGARHERCAGQHAGDRAVLRPAQDHDGQRAGGQLRTLLRDPRIRPRGQLRLQRRLGFVDDPRELGRERRVATEPGRDGFSRRARPHATAVRLPVVPALQRHRGRQRRGELHLHDAVMT